MGGFISDDKIAEVRIAANIVDVVSQDVSLKKGGKNFLGLCPFHAEKTPSFSVNEEKQIFYCFGCGQGGNVFNFLMLYHSMGFPEAVRLLAKRYGIQIPDKKMSVGQKRRMEENDRLFDINKEAVVFFRRSLEKTSSGKHAREYLARRRITPEVTDRFMIGYAPRGWQNAVDFFSSKRTSLADMEKAGLIIAKKNGYYDRFRDRIVFPILDIHERVVGFGGRSLDDSLPKYLNSPETPVYHKGRTLYGLPAAKAECRRSGSVFVVEGYFDLLALRCHGIDNVVATLGTALTRQHIRILKGYAKQVILVFDSDAAGMKAAERSLPLFGEEMVDVRIMSLPVGHDPDSYVLEAGRDRFLKRAASALDVMEFLIAGAIKKYGLSLQGKVRIVEALRGPLGSLADKVSRAVYVKHLSERLDIDESAILEQVRNAVGGDDRGKPKTRVSDRSKLEEALVAIILQSPDILSGYDARAIIEGIETDELRQLGRIILERNKENRRAVGADLISETDDPRIRNLISSLSVEEKAWDESSCLKVLGQYVTHLRRKQEKELSRKIKKAEQANNETLLHELLAEKQRRVNERLNALQG